MLLERVNESDFKLLTSELDKEAMKHSEMIQNEYKGQQESYELATQKLKNATSDIEAEYRAMQDKIAEFDT